MPANFHSFRRSARGPDPAPTLGLVVVLCRGVASVAVGGPGVQVFVVGVPAAAAAGWTRCLCVHGQCCCGVCAALASWLCLPCTFCLSLAILPTRKAERVAVTSVWRI
eukprot:1689555-Rhodomonas_salina.1